MYKSHMGLTTAWLSLLPFPIPFEMEEPSDIQYNISQGQHLDDI